MNDEIQRLKDRIALAEGSQEQYQDLWFQQGVEHFQLDHDGSHASDALYAPTSWSQQELSSEACFGQVCNSLDVPVRQNDRSGKKYDAVFFDCRPTRDVR